MMFECAQCKATFPTKWKLKRHEDKHTIFGGAICLLCDSYFRRVDALIEHWRKTCDRISCILSEEERKYLPTNSLKETVFSYIVELNSVSTSSHGDPAAITLDDSGLGQFCVYCNLLLTHSALKRHQDIHAGVCSPGLPLAEDNNSYACDLCGLTFRMKTYLLKHWRESCIEILTHIPPEGLVMRNSELCKFVENLIHSSSVIEESTYSLEASHSGKDTKLGDSHEVLNRVEDVESEHADDFAVKIIPPLNIERSKWATQHVMCTKCNRTFINSGRLERHHLVFHAGWKTKEKCDLCLSKFKTRATFLDHIRKTCSAMKTEIPDSKIRSLMSGVELMNFVRRIKPKWQLSIEKQKRTNLEEMKEFLKDSDASKISLSNAGKRLTPSFDPGPSVSKIGTFGLSCPVCKVTFQSEAMTQKHLNLVHPAEKVENTNTKPEKQKKRIPVFYDEENAKIQAGKYLIDDPVLLKQFEAGTVRANVKLKLKNAEVEKKCMIVKVNCEEKSYFVVMEDDQIGLVLNEHGKLKTLKSRPHIDFDDLPLLERQTDL